MTPSDPLHNERLGLLQAEAMAAQRALVELDTVPGRIVRAEACPGAGKTRTVVERHLSRPLEPRQGRAIVSFTKVAGAQIRARCAAAGRPDLVQFPHYIGTFDTFVWRHLVRPYLRARGERTWHRLESWRDHPKAHREGVSLDDFRFEYGPDHVRTVAPTLSRLPPALSGDENAEGRLTYWAARTMSELWEAGYLSGDQLRDMALYLLQDAPRRERIARVLTKRFSEIVVDEAQDCSGDDLEIVGLLSHLRVPLLLVQDPDQSIYGFRDQNARRIGRTADSPPDHRLRHNWRSTQIICDLAHTLRSSNAPHDIAAGPYHAEEIPVLLVPTTGRRQSDWVGDFSREAKHLDIPRQERLVVAHKGSALPKELTGTRDVPAARLDRLIWATAVLRSPSASNRQQEKAGRALREAVLQYWYGELEMPEAVGLKRHGLTTVELRLMQQVLLRELPALTVTAGEWNRGAYEAIRRQAVRLGVEMKATSPHRCRRSSTPAWKLVGFGNPLSAQAAVGRVGTVHGVKGEEADAVLVVVPPADKDDARSNRLVDTWTGQHVPSDADSDTAEALRVLYVAATRARRLLAFALSDHHLKLVKDFLIEEGIPCRSLHGDRGEQTMLVL
ncbi:ATP-dependent DNA helicase PcrA [Streptomyces acidiscabies]|nr:ATP-dependent DNA helicase PcrA [Streptomyces acidiscabies]